MSAVEIIAQIKKLPVRERNRVSAFVQSLEADDWDRQIAADAAAGRLDRLKEEARNAIRRKKLMPLP